MDLPGVGNDIPDEVIVILGLMIPFMGLLVPILALLLVQVPRRSSAAVVAEAAESSVQPDSGIPGPAAAAESGATGKVAEADAEGVAWVCGQLRESDIFEGLTDDELGMVVAIGSRRRVKRGDRLARGGSRGEELFVILRGDLRLLTHDTPEKEVRAAHPGETVPLAAIIDPPVLVTTVEAINDGEVFAIPRIRLLDLFDEQPAIALQVYKVAAKAFEHRYRMTLDRGSGSLGASAEG